MMNRNWAPHLLRRAFESWPYVFIAVSITGLSYIAFQNLR